MTTLEVGVSDDLARRLEKLSAKKRSIEDEVRLAIVRHVLEEEKKR